MFLASRPEALATGGFLKVSDAAPGARRDLLPGEATDLGDESLAFSFVRAFDDGSQGVGYEVYVRVGETVAAVSLEGPQDMPLQQVTELAAAQAACLQAGACPEALPVPEAMSLEPRQRPRPRRRPRSTRRPGPDAQRSRGLLWGAARPTRQPNQSAAAHGATEPAFTRTDL